MINIYQRSNKIVCVGKNYAAHAAEMNTPVPTEPLLFIKPWTALSEMSGEFSIPTDKGSVHHELEIAFMIGETLTNASEDDVRKGISGIGLALDLTLRDVQTKLKKKGFPWEKCKGFDSSCPIKMLPMTGEVIDFDAIEFSLIRNGKLQQEGISKQMVFSTLPLISYMSNWFTLNEGDIILTGTPEGVGPLESGDELVSSLSIAGKDLMQLESKVS